MEKRSNTGAYIASALGVILVAGALYYFFGMNERNHYYSLPQANEWVNNYQSNNGTAPQGWLASADNIRTYLNSQPAPSYLHVSLGLDSMQNEVLIISGVQADYSHTFVDSQVLQGGYSCPGAFDPNSELSPNLSVNSAFEPAMPNSAPRTVNTVNGGFGFIPVAAGQEQINQYLSSHPTNDSLNPVGWLVPRQLVDEILGEDGCRYLHIARGIAAHPSGNAKVIILSGVDQNYNHLYRPGSDGPQVVESVYPCPICIDLAVTPTSDRRVENNLIP